LCNKHLKKINLFLFLFVLWAPAYVMAEGRYLLEPMDLSSPRSTLSSFMEQGDANYQKAEALYRGAPSRALVDSNIEQAKKMLRAFDMGDIPPAASFDVGRDGLVYLYEVLSRIELPSDVDIPDASAYADKTKDKEGGNKPISWTIPHTEITLVQVEEGPQTGQFLFSSSTVIRAKEFYEKTRSLPYRRDIPFKNFPEMRHYLSMGSWLISSRTIERLPGWLKYSVYEQAIWKWIALVSLIAMIAILAVAFNHLMHRRLSAYSGLSHLHRIVTPLVLLMMPLILGFAHQHLALTGLVSRSLMLVSEATTYILLAWIAWAGSHVIAEIIIGSPKISNQSLNASLLRLVARIVGIVLVIVIMLYVSKQIGIPMYGMFAGLGVGGIAVALAAQPTIENFIGSLNLFSDKPVNVGDFCRYGEDPTSGWQRIGTVESIGSRSTKIRGIDNTITTIPNADFSRMHIVNYTQRSRMLLLTVLGLRYETTDDQLRYVITMLRDMLLAHPRVIDEEPGVRFVGFGDFALNVEIRVDVNTSDRDEFRAIREDLYFRVMKIVKDAGTGFAFPSRTVYNSHDEGLDETRQKAAEKQVRNWCAAQELPFPSFSFDYRRKHRNKLDYPPEGSPEASE
jgi:MscS family membrane protein